MELQELPNTVSGGTAHLHEAVISEISYNYNAIAEAYRIV